MSAPYVPSHKPPEERTEAALWFAFRNGDVAVCGSSDNACLPSCVHLHEHGIQAERTHYLGTYNGQHCYAVELDDDAPLPKGWNLLGLRAAFGVLDVSLAALAGRAFQIVDWDRNHRFCGRCATATVKREHEHARVCPKCNLKSYPLVSPAVMVLITDGGRRVLLARKPSWPRGRYSALAGFVEPGETLEDTIARETREEVGVEVINIRYFGSQPWPFPHSLMIAFTAEYAAGEIRPDGVEIEEARWFEASELPTLPPGISISRRLIDTIATELAKRNSRHNQGIA